MHDLTRQSPPPAVPPCWGGTVDPFPPPWRPNSKRSCPLHFSFLATVIFWGVVSSAGAGLGGEGMQTYCLASTSHGDLWSCGELAEAAAALLDGLWLVPCPGPSEEERDEHHRHHRHHRHQGRPLAAPVEPSTASVSNEGMKDVRFGLDLMRNCCPDPKSIHCAENAELLVFCLGARRRAARLFTTLTDTDTD